MSAPTIAIGELLAELDRGAPLFLLDVRNAEDFAAWRIEARRPVETLNLPYFSFLEEPEVALARLPRGRALVVVCAQGGSSEMVVELLRDAGLAARNVAGGMAAYGEHLEPEPIPLPDPERAALWQVHRRGKGCLAYVLQAGDEALVVDPSRHVAWYERFLAERGARLVRVLDTHVHADHLSGGPELCARTGAAYSVGAGPVPGELRHPVEALGDGQRLRLGGALELEVLATPGHTPGSASFLLERRFLFTGDTLFVRGLGRPDLGGQAEAWGRALFRSLHARLAKLPDETVILPAHTSGVEEADAHGVVRGTLGALRRSAEFRLASEDEFVRSVALGVAPAPESYAALVRANLGELAPEPATLAEWELGKNRCAAGTRQAD